MTMSRGSSFWRTATTMVGEKFNSICSHMGKEERLKISDPRFHLKKTEKERVPNDK